jgi:hypothetical protein
LRSSLASHLSSFTPADGFYPWFYPSTFVTILYLTFHFIP